MTPDLYPVFAGFAAQLALLMWRAGERFMAITDGIVAVLLVVAWVVGWRP